jgi:hypothetical protein
LVLKGRYLSKGIETILRNYIRDYVLCSTCKSARTELQKDSFSKLLFIYCYKYACNKAYDFILHNNSPYSITIYEDKKLLIQRQILQDTANWIPNPKVFCFAQNLDMLEKLSLQKLKNDIEAILINLRYIV